MVLAKSSSPPAMIRVDLGSHRPYGERILIPGLSLSGSFPSIWSYVSACRRGRSPRWGGVWWNRCRTTYCTLDWVVSSRRGVVASSTRTRARCIRLIIVGSCSPGGELVLLLMPAGRFGTGGFSPPVGAGSSEAETKPMSSSRCRRIRCRRIRCRGQCRSRCQC